MNFRIDPVDERGVFDHDFYSSEEYTNVVACLRRYLEAEGFELKEKEFQIKFHNRAWLCKPVKRKV